MRALDTPRRDRTNSSEAAALGSVGIANLVTSLASTRSNSIQSSTITARAVIRMMLTLDYGLLCSRSNLPLSADPELCSLLHARPTSLILVCCRLFAFCVRLTACSRLIVERDAQFISRVFLFSRSSDSLEVIYSPPCSHFIKFIDRHPVTYPLNFI